jgi:cell division protein FtsA
MPVRIGMPRDIGGLRGEVENPIHSTGVGLLLYGIAQQSYGERRTYDTSVAGDGLWERIKSWFNGNF